MTNFNKANETTERKYFVIEERRFYDRARADRSAGAFVAHCLGLDASDSDAFADRVVEAGIRSQDGRGGFDFLATQIDACGYGIEQLRLCYAALTSGAAPLAQAA
ncbi:ATPase inhibitor subunit zeta [Devosia beringensis]|uniref:ATPase inhibitor subunit zeta n=1 Tax=Devosia beringensis TaxID=2657486 RepID=UPI00186B775B|nr:ATPase inhibitor subunit zeta [Devosia beringensis]